jgi:hypothetical protein
VPPFRHHGNSPQSRLAAAGVARVASMAQLEGWRKEVEIFAGVACINLRIGHSVPGSFRNRRFTRDARRNRGIPFEQTQRSASRWRQGICVESPASDCAGAFGKFQHADSRVRVFFLASRAKFLPSDRASCGPFWPRSATLPALGAPLFQDQSVIIV